MNSAVLQRVLATCNPENVVDIGCGGGDYSFVLQGHLHFYYGLEPSPIPKGRVLEERPANNVVLIHTDPAKPLPLVAASAGMVMFLASYDHVPNRAQVLQQAWAAVKPGGYLLINMTNYGFWAKRILNCLVHGRVARHEDEHFCVHDPDTLEAEVLANCPGAERFTCHADYIWVPNSPLTVLYRSRRLLQGANFFLRCCIHDLLRQRNAGAVMICVFRKQAEIRVPA